MCNIKGNKVQPVANGAWISKEEYINRQKKELLYYHKLFNEDSGVSALVKQQFINIISKIEMELVNTFGLSWEDMEAIEMQSYKGL